jgi:hypothetical protein
MMRRFFFTAIRQIDERYGQFGSDADLCYQIRRAGKKNPAGPQARARHEGHSEESALRKADRQQGAAAWIGKYGGFGAVCARRSPRFSAPWVHCS